MVLYRMDKQPAFRPGNTAAFQPVFHELRLLYRGVGPCGKFNPDTGRWFTVITRDNPVVLCTEFHISNVFQTDNRTVSIHAQHDFLELLRSIQRVCAMIDAFRR